MKVLISVVLLATVAVLPAASSTCQGTTRAYQTCGYDDQGTWHLNESSKCSHTQLGYCCDKEYSNWSSSSKSDYDTELRNHCAVIL
ncbi:uncharacterized protein PGTG_01679 [Puccinia graminis f. sp. tritici CRL 75-36-700-3]|uniref:Uncharacterized protein n=1 Tax=Puccinia graminis f. sp. tritici (strain CRL 75-36-700-3 / race SCCL) TaxID=418459 RepID=E3JSR1_PUCGT|nr:uncharacterized protein PGTG_01679 [Puccinia graminis f. sp. tritici CRL 75-36-700-3]EFP75086.1 hypothetical protein PGTG_01679 [Puccinia graminis f. sp. tritici CRL 75-36-700-3]